MDDSFIFFLLSSAGLQSWTGGRWKEKSEKRRERARVRMSEITPEDWQHRGRGSWMIQTAGTNGFMTVKGISVESDAWVQNRSPPITCHATLSKLLNLI